jgi:hypothetical protein
MAMERTYDLAIIAVGVAGVGLTLWAIFAF